MGVPPRGPMGVPPGPMGRARLGLGPRLNPEPGWLSVRRWSIRTEPTVFSTDKYLTPLIFGGSALLSGHEVCA